VLKSSISLFMMMPSWDEVNKEGRLRGRRSYLGGHDATAEEGIDGRGQRDRHAVDVDCDDMRSPALPSVETTAQRLISHTPRGRTGTCGVGFTNPCGS
jgi:hypothetical protein